MGQPRALTRQYDSPLRQENAAATRRRILDAFAVLIAEGEGPDLSVPAVASRAGVAVRTVYRHFPTRDDLLEGVFECNAASVAVPLGSEPRSVSELTGWVREAFPYIAERAPFYRALHASRLGREIKRRRSPERSAAVVSAFRDEASALAESDRRRLHALGQLLASSVALLNMQDNWHLSPAEAAEASAWAIGVLAREASVTGQVGADVRQERPAAGSEERREP